MNILEAFLLFNNHLIIIISGLPGCHKSSFAKKLANEFNFYFINQSDYYKKDFNNIVSLPDGSTFNNYSTDDAIDWYKFNNDINNNKNKGVVISGFSFPSNLLKFETNLHIHLGITKSKCFESIESQLIKNNQNVVNEKLKFNKFVYPYYLSLKNRSSIDKFFFVDDIDYDNFYNILWSYIIDYVNSFIIWFNQNKFDDWISNTDNKIKFDKLHKNNSIKNTSDSSINISSNKDNSIKDGPIVFEYY